MKNIFLMVLFFIASSQRGFSYENGGGVIVGNGAGIVEANFQLVYQNLPHYLKNCLMDKLCPLAPDEFELAGKILKIAEQNSSKSDRLIFLSEKLNPGFFTTGAAETNRIAKTFLSDTSSIYINTDLLYSSSGAPAISIQNIIGLLIHEIGHQSGILLHTRLDILGAKVADMSEALTQHYRFEGEVDIAVTNLNYPVKSSMLLYNNWKNHLSINLDKTLYASSSCQYDSEHFSGLEMSNGHYAIDSKNNLTFFAWVKVFCYETFSDSIMTYRKSLSMQLDQEYKIVNLIIE